jgi:hypothetical protein
LILLSRPSILRGVIAFFSDHARPFSNESSFIMLTLIIAKSKLPPGSNWDQVQAGAKHLLTSFAEGRWTYRSNTFFFETASFSFANDQDAVLFKLHYSDLISTSEEEMEKRFAPAFRYADAYQERRQHLVATKGEEAANEELADQTAVIHDLLEQAENLRAAIRI